MDTLDYVNFIGCRFSEGRSKPWRLEKELRSACLLVVWRCEAKRSKKQVYEVAPFAGTETVALKIRATAAILCGIGLAAPLARRIVTSIEQPKQFSTFIPVLSFLLKGMRVNQSLPGRLTILGSLKRDRRESSTGSLNFMKPT